MCIMWTTLFIFGALVLGFLVAMVWERLSEKELKKLPAGRYKILILAISMEFPIEFRFGLDGKEYQKKLHFSSSDDEEYYLKVPKSKWNSLKILVSKSDFPALDKFREDHCCRGDV